MGSPRRAHAKGTLPSVPHPPAHSKLSDLALLAGESKPDGRRRCQMVVTVPVSGGYSWLLSSSRPHAAVRSGRPMCWTGQTVANVEIPDVPIEVLYREYADLSRMVEWSPSLESVTVDPDRPRNSGTRRCVATALAGGALLRSSLRHTSPRSTRATQCG